MFGLLVVVVSPWFLFLVAMGYLLDCLHLYGRVC